ncbi:MAG: hypothetical protein ACRYFU_06120 [Janthinobacterium lividum]
MSIVKDQKDWLDHALDWGPWVSNFLLVIVGFGQILLLKRTWDEVHSQAGLVKRQAEVMERQTALTEAAMQQWIHLDGWKSSINELSGKLKIAFNVYNPTSFLVMTERGKLKFKNLGVESTFIYRTSPLAPNKPTRYEIDIPVPKTWIENYKAGHQMGSPIEGVITFRNVFGKHISQEVVGVLSFNVTETKFEPHVRIGPYLPAPEKQENQGHNPN